LSIRFRNPHRHALFGASLRFFYTPAFPFYSIFSRLWIRFSIREFPSLLEKNMDWMDGMAVAAIALLWLATWGSVLGCVRLGARQ